MTFRSNRTGTILRELKAHAPFTALGTLTGVAVLLLVVVVRPPPSLSSNVFWTLHPAHVFLSALATAGMYRTHSRGGLIRTILVGYFGSVLIATLSDCVIPYAGETLLNLPNRGMHVGVLEKWEVVNPLAVAGALLACIAPGTKFPHAGHVVLSTWASLFHMTMALDGRADATSLTLVTVFLFLAVWIPCCTSDIVFPLVFARELPHPRMEEEGT